MKYDQHLPDYNPTISLDMLSRVTKISVEELAHRAIPLIGEVAMEPHSLMPKVVAERLVDYRVDGMSVCESLDRYWGANPAPIEIANLHEVYRLRDSFISELHSPNTMDGRAKELAIYTDMSPEYSSIIKQTRIPLYQIQQRQLDMLSFRGGFAIKRCIIQGFGLHNSYHKQVWEVACGTFDDSRCIVKGFDAMPV